MKMTCIIGARCKDGVLLAGDKRIRRGVSIYDQEKIFKIGNVPIVYAYSGTTALMDTFLKKVDELLVSEKEQESPLRGQINCSNG